MLLSAPKRRDEIWPVHEEHALVLRPEQTTAVADCGKTEKRVCRGCRRALGILEVNNGGKPENPPGKPHKARQRAPQKKDQLKRPQL